MAGPRSGAEGAGGGGGRRVHLTRQGVRWRHWGVLPRSEVINCALADLP